MILHHFCRQLFFIHFFLFLGGGVAASRVATFSEIAGTSKLLVKKGKMCVSVHALYPTDREGREKEGEREAVPGAAMRARATQAAPLVLVPSRVYSFHG